MGDLLKIDLDIHPPEEWLNEWIDTRKVILKSVGIEPVEISKFKTSRGWHVYIKIDRNVPDKTINKLQFLLGDDTTRVKINQWRIERGIKRWNKLFSRVLYRKKVKAITCYYCGNKIPLFGV